jgi:hypothetical protein
MSSFDDTLSPSSGRQIFANLVLHVLIVWRCQAVRLHQIRGLLAVQRLHFVPCGHIQRLYPLLQVLHLPRRKFYFRQGTTSICFFLLAAHEAHAPDLHVRQGSYCPSGAIQPTACPGGYLCTTTGRSEYTSATYCAAGTYCPAGVTASIPCTAGHFCPAGSTQQSACPSGGSVAAVLSPA